MWVEKGRVRGRYISIKTKPPHYSGPLLAIPISPALLTRSKLSLAKDLTHSMLTLKVT